MPDEIQLEWTYTPADLFEERAELLIDRCVFVIEGGTVIGRAPFDGNPDTDLQSFCNRLHQRLDAIFLGAQALDHMVFTLRGPTNTVRLSPDGARHFFIISESAKLTVSLGRVDVQIANAAGDTIVDTRAARIAQRKDLALKAATYIADPAANSVLRSYSTAVIDPRNELIHLYEIRDALATKFGSAEKSKKALNITSGEWSALGRLACKEPLVQGRHRGQHLDALRPATAEELSEARTIGLRMIERYLTHLEAKKP